MTLPTFAAECELQAKPLSTACLPAGTAAVNQWDRETEWTGGHPTFLRAASIRDSVIAAESYLI